MALNSIMRRTKYYPNYGYCTEKYGNGLFDVFQTVAANIPGQISTAAKDAALNVAKKGIKAAGSRLGDNIADRILKKTPRKSVEKTNESEIREKVLKDLKLLPDNYNRIVEQFGEGPKRKTRGAGLKVLI